MTPLHSTFRDVKDWIIIDCATIYTYDDEPQSIPVVNVLIGMVHYNVINTDGRIIHERSPITRWITRNSFMRMRDKW